MSRLFPTWVTGYFALATIVLAPLPAAFASPNSRHRLTLVDTLAPPTCADARALWDQAFQNIPPVSDQSRSSEPLRYVLNVLDGGNVLYVRIEVLGSDFRPVPSCQKNYWQQEHIELGIDLSAQRTRENPRGLEHMPSGMRLYFLGPAKNEHQEKLCAACVARGDEKARGPLDVPGAVVRDEMQHRTLYYLALTEEVLGASIAQTRELGLSLRVVSGAQRGRLPTERRLGLPSVSGSFPEHMCKVEREVSTSTQPAPSSEDSKEAAPRLLFDKSIRRLEEQAARQLDPERRRSVLAQSALLRQLYASLDSSETTDPAPLRRVAKAAEQIAQFTYLNAHAPTAGRRLTFAVRSTDDGRLAAHGLRLPLVPPSQGVKPPLLVVLHGKGDFEEAAFLVDLAANADTETQAPEAIVLTPFARGNMGYRDGAERDVMAAIEVLVAQGRVDPDRIMLLGFSMGGAGAYGLALHHPDVWSGVAIASGGTWLAPRGVGLGVNARHLPIWLWHGLRDTTIDPIETRWMRQELEAGGNSPSVTWGPGDGHTLPADVRDTFVANLLTTRKKSPSAFVFVTDSFAYREAFGIRLAAHRGCAERTIRASRTAGRLDLQVTGEEGMDVDLNALFSADSPEVEIWVNKKRAYKGPRDVIQLFGGSGR